MTDSAALVGTALDGKFEIVRLIDEGGMASVYEATHLLTGQRVAVKLLRARFTSARVVISRFQREARIISRLKHPHICGIVETGVTVLGAPYMVLEYLDGKSLRQILAEEGQLTVHRALRIADQALCGLAAAHEAGVVHRDLKPQNIYLIADDGSELIKLLDFGVSKLIEDSQHETSSLTEHGAVVGTLNYMSPEQALGAQNASTASDIYSIGVVLYQMLAGRLPFENPNPNALMLKILMEAPPDPRSFNAAIPPELAEAIERAMHRDPSKRFGGCEALRAHLRSFTDTRGAGTRAGAPSLPVHGRDRSTGARRSGADGAVYDAIFVCLWPSSTEVALEDGKTLKILSLDTSEELPNVLDDFFPQGIVSSALIDFGLLRARFPALRATIILIDLQATHQELVIHEWETENRDYALRRAPIAELDAEVNRFCQRQDPNPTGVKELRNIGFEDHANVNGATFQVVTEVYLRNALKIITRVWLEGRIVDERVSVLDEGDRGPVEQLAARAEAQHRAVRDQVARRGS